MKTSKIFSIFSYPLKCDTYLMRNPVPIIDILIKYVHYYWTMNHLQHHLFPLLLDLQPNECDGYKKMLALCKMEKEKPYCSSRAMMMKEMY